MDTERNLLFGILAFQNGAVDADRLAETCAAWATEPSLPLADHFVDRGWGTEALDQGVIALNGASGANGFVRACRKLRFWEREDQLES